MNTSRNRGTFFPLGPRERENGVPFVTVTVALFAVALWFVSGAGELCQYQRGDARWSAPLTSHLVHWSVDHLLWDVLAFIGLGIACERRGRARCAWTILIAAPAITLAVHALQPDLQTYRGLSGIDSALFGLLAVDVLIEKLRERDRAWVALAGLALAGFGGKIAFELATGTTLFADSGVGRFVPVPLAHLVGATVGAGVALFGGCVPRRFRHV